MSVAVRETLLELGRRLGRAARAEVPWQAVCATLLGFAAAALIPALAFGYRDCGLWDPTYLNQCTVQYLIQSVLLAYFFSLPVTLAFAVPAYFITKWAIGVWWWSALAGGIVVAMFVYLLLQLGLPEPHPAMARTIPLDVLVTVAIGGAAGYAFWLIWRLGHRRSRTLQPEHAILR